MTTKGVLLILIHIGDDEYVNAEDVLMILDYRQALDNADTHLFLRSFGADAEQIYIGRGPVRSALITYHRSGKRIYFSPITTATLLRRVDASPELS